MHDTADLLLMTIYQFGRCELDTEKHRLLVAGIERNVEPQVFELLHFLVESGDSLVSQQALIESVWKGRAVTDSAISVRINAARKVVGDNGSRQAVIKTVPRKGFKMALKVDRIDPSDDPAAHAQAPLQPGSGGQIPVVGIFPFDCLGDEIPGYLARGLVDDIAIELSRFHSIRVLSTYSTFRHDFKQTDPLEIAARLGITHAVTGSLRNHGSKWQINVHLIDCSDGSRLWSESYDTQGEELFDVQKDAAYRIVSALVQGLTEHQMSVARQKPTSSLSAYECLLRGLQIYKWGINSLEEGRQAMFWFERAVELDPGFARAQAWRACCHSCFWSSPPTDEEVTSSLQSMRDAFALDETDHEIHRLKGALHLVAREFVEAEYHLAKAVELNPNDAHILLRIGFYRHFLADNSDDLTYVDLAFERNPLHPAWYWHDRGATLYAHERYEEAIANLKRSGTDSESTLLYLAACQAALGNLEEAKLSIKKLHEMNPGANIDWLKKAYPTRCYETSDKSARLYQLLREAGL